MMQHGRIILDIQWALQEAYKIAVHNLGISDWSKETLERRRQVEIDQLKIAKLILDRLK